MDHGEELESNQKGKQDTWYSVLRLRWRGNLKILLDKTLYQFYLQSQHVCVMEYNDSYCYSKKYSENIQNLAAARNNTN